MRRTKWDTSGPDTSIDVSSVLNSTSSSTNIEAVKALAKKRLEELMLEKNNYDSNNTSINNNNTVNNVSSHPNINVLIAQASASIQEKSILHTKSISESVQKAAAIAAAFQSESKNSYLDTVPQIPPGMQLPIKNEKMNIDVLINNTVSPNINNIMMTQPIFPPPTIFGGRTIPYNNNNFNTSICQFNNNNIQNIPAHTLAPYLASPINNTNLVHNIPVDNKGYSPYLKYNKCINSKTSNHKEDVSDDDVSNDEDLSDNDDDNKEKNKDKLKQNIHNDEELYNHPKYAILKSIFGSLPKPEDEPQFNHEIEESANGMFTTDIDINFSNARNRLVRKEALQEIRLCTGAAVLCRGKIKTDINSTDKGLYLRITGDTKEKVKDAALIIEKLMIDDVKKVFFMNETNNENFLEFFFKQKAELEEYLNYIMKSTKAYIEIRGTGSNHPEDVNTQDEIPLHLVIYSLSECSRNKAELLSKKLIDYVNKQYEEQKKNKQMPTTLSPQQLGATFSGQQGYQNQQLCNPQNILSSLPQYNPYRYNNMNIPIYNNSLISPNNVQPFPVNPLFMPQRQIIPQPIPPLVNYGLSWKDLLNDEQEQSRRRKEMEEKKRKREQQREEGRKRLRSSSRSSSRSRSPSNEKRSSKLKSFNSVPPPSELCKTNLSSLNIEDNINVNHNEKSEDIHASDDHASSPIKEPNPCNKSNKENEDSSKISDEFTKEKDEESMPPPHPINFLKKSKNDLDDVCAPNIFSSETTIDNNILPSVNTTEEFDDNNEDQKNQQPVALVAYDDDSEED